MKQLSDLVQRGMAAHRAGNLVEAETLYQQALASNPDQFEALHHLGLLAAQRGELTEADRLVSRALAINPGAAHVHSNHARILRALKRPQDALTSSERALSIDSRFVDALVHRCNALRDLGRYQEALASIERALALNASHPVAWAARGDLLASLGRDEDAAASYDRAIAIHPHYAEALNNRGRALRQLARFDEALACLDRAIAIKPNYFDALNNRGLTLHAQGRLDEAVTCYDRAIAITPDHPEVILHRAFALQTLDRLEEALSAFDRALAIQPGNPQALNSRGLALYELSRIDEAVADYDRALAARPDDPDAGVNRAFAQLLSARYEEGWNDWECRHRTSGPKSPPPPRPAPPWNGESLQDKSIVVYWEQGHGDIIQFARYLPMLAELGARVTFLSPLNLLRLLRPLAPKVEVTSTCAHSRVFDFQCALLSLPRAFKTGASTIPNRVPYLDAEPELTASWRELLGTGGFKIGVCWQGNPKAAVDKGRSVALSEFFPLAQVPDVRLISLQRINGLDQLDRLPAGMTVETFGDDFAPQDAFVDIAAMMMSLDLVVTTDTATAHLAGALARPTWVALKCVPDWRWLLDRDDSPWYPRMRLFRQPERGNWEAVFSRMAADLPGLVAAHR